MTNKKSMICRDCQEVVSVTQSCRSKGQKYMLQEYRQATSDDTPHSLNDWDNCCPKCRGKNLAAWHANWFAPLNLFEAIFSRQQNCLGGRNRLGGRCPRCNMNMTTAWLGFWD